MRFFYTLSLLGVFASTALAVTADDCDYLCGSETIGDAEVSDCEAAIEQIDTSLSNAGDPSDAIEVVTTDPYTQWAVMYRVGTCSVATLTRITIGSSTSAEGTLVNGQELYDLAKATLGCQDSTKGLVNGHAAWDQMGVGIGKL
ncbi:hypothetical protein FE257_006296 [Aspergillus nanangensis]|uniref:Uncharacterized protein n=1 Tax=Aspergillus nanangensis TaxID=2582783 RepID=A0AAD4CP49_ASPNN|nr:hypothetical protein FE257_006296 [Aspergillus nanangensis]